MQGPCKDSCSRSGPHSHWAHVQRPEAPVDTKAGARGRDCGRRDSARGLPLARLEQRRVGFVDDLHHTVRLSKLLLAQAHPGASIRAAVDPPETKDVT